MANLVTLGRVGLTFVAVMLLYSGSFWLAAPAVLLTVLALLGDCLDGWVARRFGKTSEFGAVFDVAGDRMVENVYFIAFAHMDLLPLWVPLVIVVRSFGIDALRSIALNEGRTAFGDKTMMHSRFGKALSSSRTSRGLYGVAKGASFSLLAALVAWRLAPSGLLGPSWVGAWLEAVALSLTYFVVAFCLIRGLAVVYDARYQFLGQRQPGAGS
jgi:CDP-diacylglycerol---glycerol-3-phosphate 3-phosphatidyltransferase